MTSDEKRKVADDAIDETKSALLARAAFIASLLYSPLVRGVVYDPEEKTASTDGGTIYVGDWFIGLPLPERMFVAAHEVMHVILDHVGRADDYRAMGFGPDLKDFNSKKWNSAGDYIINHILTESRIGKMPHGGLYNPHYTGDMMTDVLYSMLPDEGDENFDNHRPGSGGKGRPRSDEQKAARAAAGVTALKQALANAKAMGQCPAGLERVIDGITEPKRNWREDMRDFLQQYAGTDELTWSRIRRKSLVLPPGIPQPGKTGFQLRCAVLAIDTSGSISAETMKTFLGCVWEIIEQVVPEELHILWWDTRAAHTDATGADEHDVEQLHPYGGGGTNYSCVPPMIRELQLDPDVLICLTDGMVRWPDASQIHWPHLTVSTTSYEAPFGRTVRMEEA